MTLKHVKVVVLFDHLVINMDVVLKIDTLAVAIRIPFTTNDSHYMSHEHHMSLTCYTHAYLSVKTSPGICAINVTRMNRNRNKSAGPRKLQLFSHFPFKA